MSERIPENVAQKLREIADQHAKLSAQLMDGEILSDHRKVKTLSIKKAAIASIVEQFESYVSALALEQELAEIIGGGDKDLADLARDELPKVKEQLTTLTSTILKQLVTADKQSVGSLILEIRAGVGGDTEDIRQQLAIVARVPYDLHRARVSILPRGRAADDRLVRSILLHGARSESCS